MTNTGRTTWLSAAAFCAALAFTAQPVTAPAAQADQGHVEPPGLDEARKLAEQPPVHEPPGNRPPLDHSGRKQAGKASFYGHEFAGKKMANGKKYNPNASVAASKSLPLGTVAKVTNLNTGNSATVRVEDRGPYVKGRVVDVTPKVAKKLEMTKEGVAPVVVAPIAVPQPSGDIKPGAGAAEVPPSTAARAIEEARQAVPTANAQQQSTK